MKKLALILTTLVVVYSSCKKKDKKEDELNTTPLPTINIPPASGDYWVTLRHDGNNYKANWTQDFETFHLLTSEYNCSYLARCGDTLLIAGSEGNAQSFVAFGNINNPAGFKKINSSRYMQSVAFINGVVLALAVDGNNYYYGTCNANAGATDIVYTLSSASIFKTFNYVGHAVITNVTNSGVDGYLGYTRKGNTWNITTSPKVNYSNFQYQKIGNTTYATTTYGSFYSTTDTAYASAWIDLSIPTSVDSGSVYSRSPKYINGTWKSYCFASSPFTGNYIPFVFTSTVNGQSWNRQYLTGIPTYTPGSNPSISNFYIGKNKTIVSVAFASSNQKDIFTSTDGLNFTKRVFADFDEYNRVDYELYSSVYFP
jgi:hypothetical protein